MHSIKYLIFLFFLSFSNLGLTDPPGDLELPGAFFPKSISYSPLVGTGTFFVSSIATGEIVKIPVTTSIAETFVPASVNTNSTGIKIDHSRSVLWSCNVDLSLANPSELRAFDMNTAELIAAYQIPDGGQCGNITQSWEDVIYVTDTLLARVLVMQTPDLSSAENGMLSVWADDPVLVGSPEATVKINGIAWSRGAWFENNRVIYTTNQATGTLYQIPILEDGSAGQVSVIETDQPLSSPDGILKARPYPWSWVNPKEILFVVQNTGDLARVTVKNGVGTVTVSAGHQGLDQPTAVFDYGYVQWVTEGQVLRFDGTDPSPLNLPFRVRKLPYY